MCQTNFTKSKWAHLLGPSIFQQRSTPDWSCTCLRTPLEGALGPPAHAGLWEPLWLETAEALILADLL